MEKNSSENNQSTSETIGILFVYAVLICLLIYIAGANYTYRYHHVMNIQDVPLIYSFREFNPSAFLIAFLLSITCMFLFDIINKVLPPIVVNWVAKRNSKQVPIEEYSQKPFSQGNNTKFLKNCISLVSAAILLTFLVSISQITGTISGEKALQNNNMLVSISSSSQLIKDENISMIQIDGQYVYENLRLLTVYNGVYYLTDKINPATCKPETVYAVDESAVSVMSLSVNDPSVSLCR